MKIKVCGLKNPENLLAVTDLRPDFVGFIRYEKSPRFANELSVDTLREIPLSIVKTGVFVDAAMETVEQAINEFGFDAIQLHGKEDAFFCAALKGKVTVLKAFGIDENFDFDTLIGYAPYVDYFLFDTKTSIHGGSGKTFDWSLLNGYKLDIPFFLSGGLSVDNISELTQMKHPAFYGVDLNSRFESAPGVKDINKLKQAFALLNHIENEIRS